MKVFVFTGNKISEIALAARLRTVLEDSVSIESAISELNTRHRTNLFVIAASEVENKNIDLSSLRNTYGSKNCKVLVICTSKSEVQRLAIDHRDTVEYTLTAHEIFAYDNGKVPDRLAATLEHIVCSTVEQVRT